MKKISTILLGVVLFILSYTDSASAGMPEAVTYLQGQTQDAWITQALIAAGETNVPTDHLTSVAAGGFNPANDYAKTILALAAAGKNPTTFGDIDYVAKLKTYYDGTQMGDATLLNDDIWSILALASIYQTNSKEAVAAKNFLLANQNDDGGWGYAVDGSSGSNDTAAAVMALLEAGIDVNNAVITNAVAFLHTMQNNDGGFMNDPMWGTDSDSGSDGWVISAIYRIGQDPAGLGWTKNGSTSVDHLETLQDADGGFWWVDPASSPAFNNKAMTPYAVIASAGKSFPVAKYEIPKPTKISANKNAFNFSETAIITAEYLDNESWLPLAGAAISGGNQNYTTNDLGKVEMVLPSGNYTLQAAKDNYAASNKIEITVLTAPSVIIVSPVNSGGGTSPVSTNETMETDETKKLKTTETEKLETDLTVEQEKNEENILGVKVEAEPVNEITTEAESIAQGEVEDFTKRGTETTKKLGAGERAGVLNSYQAAFGKMPETAGEWEDVIKIGNGELPNEINPVAEDKAKIEFKKIYNRECNLENPNDQKAINMMAYGLRPQKRDLDLERAGIKKFVEIYKYLPSSAIDWDTVRAIAYNT